MRRGHYPKHAAGNASGEMAVTCPCPCGSTDHVIAYCINCRKLACVICLGTKHKFHNTENVSIVATETRERIKELTTPQTTQAKFDDVEKAERLSADNKSELETMETQTIGRIIEHIDSLREQLKKIEENLIKNVTDLVERDMKHFRDAERNLKKVAASIETLCDTANQIVSETDDIKVIERGYDFPEELTEAFNTPIPTPVRGPAFGLNFVPGTLDTSILTAMCGKVSKLLCYIPSHCYI